MLLDKIYRLLQYSTMSTNNKELNISSTDDIEGINEIDDDASFDDTKGVCSRITESNCTVQFCNPKLQDPQKKQVSIDVTKALLVLGFDSWSGVVEGKYQ